MEQFVGRVALVTGASVGIGAAVAKSLVQAGMIVIGAARRYEKLQELETQLKGEKGKLIPIKCDLEKDEEVNSMFEIIEKEYGGVDVLVNNAAKLHHSSLLDATTEIWRSMLNLNVVAVALCTQLAIKSMRKRGKDDGHIIMLSSDSAYDVQSYDFLRFYCATKYCLRAYTKGIRQEIKKLKSGIKISSVSPGATESEIWKSGLATGDVSDSFKYIVMMKPEDVAASIMHILTSPREVEIQDVFLQPLHDEEFA